MLSVGAIWESYPNLVLGLLAGLDLLLCTYVLKSTPKVVYKMQKGKGLTKIRQLKKLGPNQLFNIKQLLDDKNDSVALYALRAIAKSSSNSINPAALKSVLFRASKHKYLLISCLRKIAEGGNSRIIAETINPDLPEWIYIACLKVLSKAKAPETVEILVNAQEHHSAEIQNAARELLEKAEVTKIETQNAA